MTTQANGAAIRKAMRCRSGGWLLLRRLPLLLLLLALAPGAAARQWADDAAAVCVVAPRVEPVEEADAAGVVPVPRPRLLVIEPLQELRLERLGAGQSPRSWRRLAAPGTALPMPLDWPVAPIQPGETVLLRLRPQGVAATAFAHVLLVGAPQARMAATAQLITLLGSAPQAWLAAIETALLAGDVPVAWALLFAPEAPASAPLQELRDEVVRRGCGD